MLTPGGGQYIILLASASFAVSHQLLRTPLLKFFWGGMLFFTRSLSFDFCYELHIWVQGEALRAFFVVICFSIILSKYERDFDQKCQEAKRRHLAHDPIIGDL